MTNVAWYSRSGGGSNPLTQQLRVRGHCFELADGTHWTAIQCSDFHLFGRFLNGEDITPILAQRAAIGFNLLRVWTRYQLAQYGIGDCTLAMHPDLYSRVPAFLNLCASYGLYVEFTAYTGREDFDPEHWQTLGAAALTAKTLPLMELVNENDQGGNAIDVSHFQEIPGLLCSRGSNGSQQPPVGFSRREQNGMIIFEPIGVFRSGYSNAHFNGASQEQRKIGHGCMEWSEGGQDQNVIVIGSEVPTLGGETSRFPEVGMWTDGSDWRVRAFDSAAGAALLCAGSCFHSVQGKNSTLFDADHVTAATAWVEGAKSIDLSQQDAPYLRIDRDLREYHRGSAMVWIRP